MRVEASPQALVMVCDFCIYPDFTSIEQRNALSRTLIVQKVTKRTAAGGYPFLFPNQVGMDNSGQPMMAKFKSMEQRKDLRKAGTGSRILKVQKESIKLWNSFSTKDGPIDGSFRGP